MEILNFLVLAWILQLFNFDHVFIAGTKEVFDKEVTIYSYYFVFFLLGVIYEFLSLIFKKETPTRILKSKLKKKNKENEIEMN